MLFRFVRSWPQLLSHHAVIVSFFPFGTGSSLDSDSFLFIDSRSCCLIHHWDVVTWSRVNYESKILCFLEVAHGLVCPHQVLFWGRDPNIERLAAVNDTSIRPNPPLTHGWLTTDPLEFPLFRPI